MSVTKKIYKLIKGLKYGTKAWTLGIMWMSCIYFLVMNNFEAIAQFLMFMGCLYVVTAVLTGKLANKYIWQFKK